MSLGPDRVSLDRLAQTANGAALDRCTVAMLDDHAIAPHTGEDPSSLHVVNPAHRAKTGISDRPD